MSKNIYNHVRDCHQYSLPQPSKTEHSTNQYSSKKSSEDQDFLMIPGRTKVNQSAQISHWKQILAAIPEHESTHNPSNNNKQGRINNSYDKYLCQK